MNAQFSVVHVDAIHEMISMLPTLTIPGQRYNMQKIVCALDAYSGPHQNVVRSGIGCLAHETERIAFDLGAFSRGAASLLALIADRAAPTVSFLHLAAFPAHEQRASGQLDA